MGRPPPDKVRTKRRENKAPAGHDASPAPRLPDQLAHSLPRYEAIPAALIGRLARHERAKGSGIGDLLVADAVKRVLAAAKSVAAYAIVVDAKDERGRRFYESHGLISLPSRPNRLFLLRETAAAALAAAAERKEGE